MNMEANAASTMDVESGAIRGAGSRLLRYFHVFVSPIFIQAFVLTFLAEWGDRSQIMTIVLAAREVSISDYIRIICILKFCNCRHIYMLKFLHHLIG